MWSLAVACVAAGREAHFRARVGPRRGLNELRAEEVLTGCLKALAFRPYGEFPMSLPLPPFWRHPAMQL